ncbi:LOW QUALITY PROTEIN: transcription factor E3 [Nilaparvata lugens]|uniref:LOW QUALITY PROTEIN: transcription factor E3 n=1 Tax=Nilaparvata lugens TaxID=108931 RepID=UPI00193E87CE|nr:LOW QUALITY PROTEIN: transcription factor E3 [Nilaparvata lugens]
MAEANDLPVCIHVGIGIDDDLRLILDMDPSLMDLPPQKDLISSPAVISPPTFKTSTSTSRTNLKLQLMREQQQQQEKRAALAKSEVRKHNNCNTTAIPQTLKHADLPGFGLQVPQKVLRVQTALENPTRYHVMQKQKNQVRQFITETMQNPNVMQMETNARDNIEKSVLKPPIPPPMISAQQPQISSRLGNVPLTYSGGQSNQLLGLMCDRHHNEFAPNKIVRSPVGNHHLSHTSTASSESAISSIATTPSEVQNEYEVSMIQPSQKRFTPLQPMMDSSLDLEADNTNKPSRKVLTNNDASPESAISSIATSPSEAEEFFEDFLSNVGNSINPENLKTSQSLTLPDLDADNTEMYIDHLISLNSGSSAPDPIKAEPPQYSEADLHALAKDRQKKDNHNMIERRRRFNINDRIKELGTLLPKNNEQYFEVVRDFRPNKGTILKSSVEYIKALKQEVQKLKQMQFKTVELETENEILCSRVKMLENLAKSHGLPLPEYSWQTSSESISSTSFLKNSLAALRKSTDLLSELNPLSSVDDLMDDEHGVVMSGGDDPMLSSSSPLPHLPLPPSPLSSDIDMMVPPDHL